MGTNINQALKRQLRSPAQIRAAGHRAKVRSRIVHRRESKPLDETGYRRIMGLILRPFLNPTLAAFLRAHRRQ